MKNKKYQEKKSRELSRYRVARNHWAKYDTDILWNKLNDISFVVYDFISAQALRDELKSREVKK